MSSHINDVVLIMISLSISGPWPNACCLFLSYWCLHECCAYWCNSCSLQCNFPGSFRLSCKFRWFFCMHWLLQNNMLSALSWILLIWHNMQLIFTIYCKCIACLSYLCLETSLSCNCHPSRTFFAVKQVWWLTFWITHLLMIMLDPGYQNRGLLDSWYEFMIHGSPFF